MRRAHFACVVARVRSRPPLPLPPSALPHSCLDPEQGVELCLFVKDADAEVKKCKKAAEESQKKWESKEQEEGSLKMELGELR